MLIVDPDEVFESLNLDSKSGVLSRNIAGGSIRYQVSLSHNGYIEKVLANGEIAVGEFINGEFHLKD